MGKIEHYRLSFQETAKQLDVDTTKGLGSTEVKRRLESYGSNSIQAYRKVSWLKLFLSQFNDVLIIILLIAAGVSYALGFLEDSTARSATESILIFTIVIAIALIGFFNEYKAERTVEALRKLVGHKARVRRNSEVIEVDSINLVPGDIVLLEEGVKIPADIRLFQVKNLNVNESSLTGESSPVSKNTFPINKTSTLGDQKNMVFSGTIITSGTGEGIVVGTAQTTEIGKIAHLVESVEEEETPMQRKLDELGRKIGAIVMIISILVFVVIFLMEKSEQKVDILPRLIFAFTAAVALAVAAIPEGLAFVVRISLALGARRMAVKNALIRKLSAVEALGSTDVICSDKTGTLTKGEMTVTKLWVSGQFAEVSGAGYSFKGGILQNGSTLASTKLFLPLLQVGVLCNNARVKDDSLLGDPTEGALIVSGAKVKLDQETLIRKFARIDEVPFSSERKMMSTLHQFRRGYLVASKGAPEVIIKKCDRILVKGKVVKLNKKHEKEILSANAEMANKALRVLGFAYRERKNQPGSKAIEDRLIFIGLQGMIDPPREEVANVIHRVQTEAGMRIIMITGDFIDTAKAIAKEIGINGESISGTELDLLTQEEFEERVEKIAVYARVNPEHKIRIVQALKKHGHQVAMTGDGVNDAPAIKAADIGIAMGITGTDAAKEASDMILLDDKFVTIIAAIEEGRGIFDNVRKFVNYLLSANIAEILTVFGGIVLTGDLLVTAAMLLFINIATDGLPAVALGGDPAQKNIMRYKPHMFQQNIINNRIWVEMVIFGSFMSVMLIGQYWWLSIVEGDKVRAMTSVFTAMVIYQMVRLISVRSSYKLKLFSNPWLSFSILLSVLLILGVVYSSWANRIFGITPLESIDWIVIFIGSINLFVGMYLVGVVLDKVFNKPEPQYSAEHYTKF